MKVRKVAAIIFYDDKGRVLIQDRRAISKHGEEWGYFGGGIEKNETPEQAIKREIKEELNYTLNEFTFLKKYTYTFKNILHVEVNMFVAPLPNLSELIQKEGTNMELFNLSDAKKLKMVTKEDNKILDDFEKWFGGKK